MNQKPVRAPRLPRELNRSCKLSESDLSEAREMRRQGHTYKSIGARFSMTLQGMRYALMTPEQKLEVNRRNHQKDTPEKRQRANEASRAAVAYKRQVLRDKMLAYEKEQSAEYRKLHPQYQRDFKRRYYYREKVGGRWIGAVERKQSRDRNGK